MVKLDQVLGFAHDETDADVLASALLPGLPAELIRACYAAAPGKEIASSKFASPESSAVHAARHSEAPARHAASASGAAER